MVSRLKTSELYNRKHSTPDLLNQAIHHLRSIGADHIEVLDGINKGHSKFKKPIPDIVAMLKGKKVAVECGYLANKDRFQELKKAGYEIIIWLPKLEIFFQELRVPWWGQ